MQLVLFEKFIKLLAIIAEYGISTRELALLYQALLWRLWTR